MSYIIQRFILDVGADINNIGEPFEATLKHLEMVDELLIHNYTNPTTIYPPEQMEGNQVEPKLAKIIPAVNDTLNDLSNVIDRESDIEEIRKALKSLEQIEATKKNLVTFIQAEIHARLTDDEHKHYIHKEDFND